MTEYTEHITNDASATMTIWVNDAPAAIKIDGIWVFWTETPPGNVGLYWGLLGRDEYLVEVMQMYDGSELIAKIRVDDEHEYQPIKYFARWLGPLGGKMYGYDDSSESPT